MSAPSTPRSRKTSFTPATPSTRLVPSSQSQASPHYATTRRHSLYGVEDRVVIDPGSRIWKVGFSGEGRPRSVFTTTKDGRALWSLERATGGKQEREEEERMLYIELERCLRSVFHDALLTDPKARKVILVEHPMLPLYIKDMIARILFQNLHVPSISFASSHLLSLLSIGRITGLVLDCGHLESVALPIFAARPLFPHIRTTPLAGSRLSQHLRSLLLLFGTYLPPPSSLSSAANIPQANRSTRVPQEILTDKLIEDIKTRCCFAVDGIQQQDIQQESDVTMEPIPPPPSSDSEFSQATESEFSDAPPRIVPKASTNEDPLQALASLYMRNSTATPLQLKVTPPLSQQTGTGLGTLLIPGWIRERSAEVLFEGGDVDERNIAETILDSLLKVPVDLRKALCSSILVTGGTAMLPGFLPRLQAEILRALAPPPPSPSSSPSRRVYDRYASLRPLTNNITIVNNPNGGKAPGYSMALMPWIGGSLSGSLKTGGVEVVRERWDIDDEDQAEEQEEEEDVFSRSTEKRKRKRTILPDWSRSPLSAGAPPVGKRIAAAGA